MKRMRRLRKKKQTLRPVIGRLHAPRFAFFDVESIGQLFYPIAVAQVKNDLVCNNDSKV